MDVLEGTGESGDAFLWSRSVERLVSETGKITIWMILGRDKRKRYGSAYNQPATES